MTSRETSFECRDCLHGSVLPFETTSVLPGKRIIKLTALRVLHRTQKALIVGRVVENSTVSAYYIPQMSQARRDDGTAETDG